MDIRMSDGLLVSFPEGMPISEIKEQTEDIDTQISGNEKEGKLENVELGDFPFKAILPPKFHILIRVKKLYHT